MVPRLLIESGLILTCDGGRRWGEDTEKEKGKGSEEGGGAGACKQEKIKVT